MDRRQALRGRPERVDNTPRDDNETDLRNRQPTGDTNKDRTEDTTADIERRGRATCWKEQCLIFRDASPTKSFCYRLSAL